MNFVTFLLSASTMIFVAYGLYGIIRRNLRQRSHARRVRRIFLVLTNRLLKDPELPKEEAEYLVRLASVPEGWMTRGVLGIMAKRVLFGKRRRRKPKRAMGGKHVPKHLRQDFTRATFALILADSYRCAVLGHVLRAIVPWLQDAVNEIEPDDVGAHSTVRIMRDVRHRMAKVPYEAPAQAEQQIPAMHA